MPIQVPVTIDVAIGEPWDFEFAGLRVRKTGAYLNGETIAWLLKDSALNPVGGMSGNLTYDNVPGQYSFTMPGNATLTQNGEYQLELSATTAAGPVLRKIGLRAVFRGAS